MRLITVFLCVLMLSQAAFGQRHKTNSSPLYRPPAVLHNSHTFELGTQLFNFDYKEVWQPPSRSNESGFIPSLSLGYTYRGYSVPLYARANFEYTWSPTTYEGTLFLAAGGSIPVTDESRNRFLRFEVQGGYTFRLGQQITLTPYAGYGHRYWVRILADPGGYREDYSWNYVPVGARASLQLGRDFALGLDVALRFMFGGSISFAGVYDDPTLDLGNKLGFRLSLPSSYRFSPHWALGFEPWFEFSGIDESNHHYITRTAYVYEPESSTNIFGTNITLQYGF